MSPDHDKKKASKSGLPAMFTRNYQNDPLIETYLEKSVQRPFFRATLGRNPMLARGDDGGRAIARNARLARRFRAVSHELATSLELASCTRDSAAVYTQ